MTGTAPAELAAADLGGATVDELLHVSPKCVLAAGRLDGEPVVIKLLRGTDPDSAALFAHEIGVYRIMHRWPPPASVPALRYTDGHRLLVVNRLAGSSAASARQPERALSERTARVLLDAVQAFARWQPPSGTLRDVFGYRDRVDRYHHGGWFDGADRTVLHEILDEAGPADRPQHGDAIPANVVISDRDWALVDFEYTGLYLPGFDLAVLHTMLSATPGLPERLADLAADITEPAPWLVNRALLLARERRLNHELPLDTPGRRPRTERLEAEWHHLRTQLHEAAG